MFVNSPPPIISRLLSGAVEDLNAIEENAATVFAEIPTAYSAISKKNLVEGVNECAIHGLNSTFYTEFTKEKGQEYRTILRVLPVDEPKKSLKLKLLKAKKEAKNNNAVFYYFDSVSNSFERSE